MTEAGNKLAGEDLIDELDSEVAEAAEDWLDSGLLWAAFRTVVVVAFVATMGVFAWQELFPGLPETEPAVRVAPAEDKVAPAPAPTPQPYKESYGGSRELVVTAGGHGHFEIRAEVEGADVDFLVDTGASKVFLSARDAENIGLDPELLDYSDRFRTANGTVYGAPVTLRELRIGNLLLHDVEATVTRSRLPISLLGMSFLGRLDGYEVRDGVLILKY